MTDLPAILSRLGISPNAYRSRLSSGWPIERAQTVPKHGGWGIGKGRVVKKPRESVVVYPLTEEQVAVSQLLSQWKRP